MILQKLLFPKKGICEEKLLYFRGDISGVGEDEVYLWAGETLSLESYFNCFSIGKWMRYTRLDELYLSLRFSGDVKIKAVNAVGDKRESEFLARDTYAKVAQMSRQEYEIPTALEDEQGGGRIYFGRLPKEGILFVEITAVTDAVISGGTYETRDREDINDIRLSFNICTFRREGALKKNVDKLLLELIENPASPVYRRGEVYISDNGQTLPADLFDYRESVHIIPNKNVGGAGGFTRTIIESVLYRRTTPFSHVILMDDDIEFDAAIIERVYMLLTLMQTEYRDANVCGAMLELERQYMQFENGAFWKGVNIRSFNHGWDLRDQKAVSANEADNAVNYGGWWFCCIPTSVINENNLPLPVFIHYDDIEYGRRLSHNGIILMNGIGVWHPYGDNKQPNSMNYYDERNIMITMAVADEPCTLAKMIDHLSRITTRDVMRYRYEAAQVSFSGIEDFLNGPEAFMELDPVENHKRLMEQNYKWMDPVEAGVDPGGTDVIHSRRYEDYPVFVPWLEILCWGLPLLGGRPRVVDESDIGYGFLSRETFFYDSSRKQGYLLKRERKKTKASFKKYFEIKKRLEDEFADALEEWRCYGDRLKTLEFWEEYLGLK
ncbi:MAG: glycosyltransferase [Lachnospiraceae bacterium]|nr:glycosyltransferase [Lachnospiraceae bacterium]